jgi:hypothetical protein
LSGLKATAYSADSDVFFGRSLVKMPNPGILWAPPALERSFLLEVAASVRATNIKETTRGAFVFRCRPSENSCWMQDIVERHTGSSHGAEKRQRS